MSIFNRVNDVIQSNIAAMLDKAEDPEKLLNLMLSEMQEALNECRSTAAALLCEEKTLKRQIAQKQKDLTLWQTKAELAVAKNRDDLAKSALVEKQRVDEQIAAKNTQLNTLKESIEKITADCERLQQKMAQAKSKQAQLIKRHDIVAAREKVNMQLHSDNVANALSRFEMIEQKVEGIEAQVDAYELTNTAQSTAEQIESLVKNEKIDAELARLKASVKQSNTNTTAPSA
ncbi:MULTISPECIES: PspA/IM30 family protein [Pseudoalteromonas]|jgi:phage shock protein A|uniref:Phage shock protein PspA n=1 Tax=Pseudoalteromonas atlantica TaxID=288 RepID=A0ABQ0UD33_PSEAF|nr:MULTISPECIES: PspA/IM30 family protein [unclassified Pseudoalteromonas]MDC9521219.1 PspA/IM30 family protein [Pseudoalteromonas sp. Angola-31]MDY6887994.1 PspA/IM30 family protein [Pseudomonadota bacterium]GEK76379.1 phage shock protein PspA [Pseudoalteromonas atlantica]MDC9501212.1 PspA/IM30 family protein [Pseudoalteromonas sp. Angola-18]MDC9524673.1 PspA/IM30 family protein [Pseudoalteromonas sp. Angola-30]|tara:strand:- start:130 stop:822 length:693 start_codon:yes stop_codon:yes gene_type:complete